MSALGSGSPIAGAVVTAQGQSATSGGDGRYAITGLTTGSTLVSASRSGYDPYAQTVTLTAGPNVWSIELSQSTSGTSVTGTVSGYYPVDGSTQALSGATVSIAGKTDTTDAAGHFQLPTIPEGNQTVTVTLAGWAPFSQTFFISSTNRNLTITLTYTGPDLRGVTPEFLPHLQCSAASGPYEAEFITELRSLQGTIAPKDAFTIDASYSVTVLINGHQPSSLRDPVRKGNLGSSFTCGPGFGGCSNLPVLPSAGGTIRTRTNAGSYTNMLMTYPYLGYAGVGSIDPNHIDGAAYRVWVDRWTSTPDCPDITDHANSLLFYYQGTITLRYANDVNRWTHTSISFQTTAVPLF